MPTELIELVKEVADFVMLDFPNTLGEHPMVYVASDKAKDFIRHYLADPTIAEQAISSGFALYRPTKEDFLHGTVELDLVTVEFQG